MKNMNYRIVLTVAACAFAAAGALFSGTSGLTQIKTVKTPPVVSVTPVKNIEIVSNDFEIAALKKKTNALAKQNADLQKQINELKARLDNPDNSAMMQQISVVKSQIGGLEGKLGSHTHRLSFDAMNLPTLGCKTCSFQPLVLTYNKSHEQTSAPIFK